MQHDMINMMGTMALVVGFGLTLWNKMRDIARAVVEIDNDDDREVFMDALDELDPNTLQGLAWQMIKVWANAPANDWLEHV